MIAQDSDILIVGAGTAGCPLAARLCTALPNHTITLLERASPRSSDAEFYVRAPRKLFSTWVSPELLETFESLPNPALNRSHTVLTGSTLGGTSAITGLQWTVPLPGSVENWGIQGLTTESARPYFQRAYDQLSVSAPASPLLYASDYINAAVRAGFSRSLNHLDSIERSVWQNRLTIDSQFRRTDSCSAYVLPLLDGRCAHNLKLIQNVTVSKLILSRSGPLLQAHGVEAIQTLGENRTKSVSFRARRETILAAGPYGSPKILQLSGIGPRDVLEQANVSSVLDLPVGAKTVCRTSGSISSRYTGVPNEPSNNFTLVEDPEQRSRWERGEPSVLRTPVSAANGRAGRDGYFGSSFIPYWPGIPEVRSFCHSNVESKGFMRIRDSDPFSPPIVQNNLLGSRQDLDRMDRCLRSLMEIHKSFPKRFNMSFTKPEQGNLTEEWIKRTINTGAHFVSACPVGEVLTERLEVRGVNGLRVIDSSSLREMPISAGPLASVVMLAEYMADFIAKEFTA